MSKQILVPNGMREKLMKMFNTTYPTVRAALKFQTHTDLAFRIRKVALENMGGVESDIKPPIYLK